MSHRIKLLMTRSVNIAHRLCARSWLARHPATIEITRCSGGSSHHTKIFFFFCKNHDFSPFLINFSTVVVVKHTHVVDLKRLTHIHELIVVIHGEYIPPGTHAVNVLEGRAARTPGSTRRRLELQR